VTNKRGTLRKVSIDEDYEEVRRVSRRKKKTKHLSDFYKFQKANKRLRIALGMKINESGGGGEIDLLSF